MNGGAAGSFGAIVHLDYDELLIQYLESAYSLLDDSGSAQVWLSKVLFHGETERQKAIIQRWLRSPGNTDEVRGEIRRIGLLHSAGEFAEDYAIMRKALHEPLVHKHMASLRLGLVGSIDRLMTASRNKTIFDNATLFKTLKAQIHQKRVHIAQGSLTSLELFSAVNRAIRAGEIPPVKILDLSNALEHISDRASPEEKQNFVDNLKQLIWDPEARVLMTFDTRRRVNGETTWKYASVKSEDFIANLKVEDLQSGSTYESFFNRVYCPGHLQAEKF